MEGDKSMIVDKVASELRVGDTVRCEGLEYEIESFDGSTNGELACGKYGCIAVGLVVRVEGEDLEGVTSFGSDWVP